MVLWEGTLRLGVLYKMAHSGVGVQTTHQNEVCVWLLVLDCTILIP